MAAQGHGENLSFGCVYCTGFGSGQDERMYERVFGKQKPLS